MPISNVVPLAPKVPVGQKAEAPNPQVATVGRIVAYYTTSLEHRAAIVTEVDDDVVSLTVFNRLGGHFVEGVPFSDKPKSAHWSWPPKA